MSHTDPILSPPSPHLRAILNMPSCHSACHGAAVPRPAWLKFVIFTRAGTAQLFESIGFSGAFSDLVIATERAGGIALILGL
jgi:hypothetical protein